jgi:cytochrome c
MTGGEFKSAQGNDNNIGNVSNSAPIVAPKDLSEYVGKYKMSGLPFEYIEVSIKDGKLNMQAGEQGGEVQATNTPDKYDAGGKATILFVRDETKKVTSLKMKAMGFNFTGKKE